MLSLGPVRRMTDSFHIVALSAGRQRRLTICLPTDRIKLRSAFFCLTSITT